MKLVTFNYKNLIRVGAVIDNLVIDGTGNIDIPDNMIDFLSAGGAAKDLLQALIDSGNQRIPLNQVKLLAPVPRPRKFLGISLNYPDHINETGLEKPKYPTFLLNTAAVLLPMKMPFKNL